MKIENINDVVDYVIVKLNESGKPLNLLKLQKLIYYIQAWSLALKKEPLFQGKFQAWVHGPVNRQIFDRFKETHSLYSSVDIHDVQKTFDMSSMDNENINHINAVLEAYGDFAGYQLEELTHREEPWIAARGDISTSERCETELDEALMGEYYSKRV